LLPLIFLSASGQQPGSSPPKPEFEVASVKPLGPDNVYHAPEVDQQRFVFKSTLYSFIGRAYRAFFACATKTNSGDCAFPGAPAWIDKARFAIEAKMPENSPAYTRSQFMQGRAPQLDLMLQALLEDRFKLKVHWETKELPVYALTVGKNGPKLKPTAAPQLMQGPGGISLNVTSRLPNGNSSSTLPFNDSSMQDLADRLAEFMDRPVLDRTGLKGNFDFRLSWETEPDAPTNGGLGLAGSMMHAGPAMFAAIQEQLGLKLEATKGPVEVLVIDHVEEPSEN
jgi:uncharacterized protein (TIGR03435 family)